jgi:fermentation-respiration switch protein FrsA (DUF1100 family)
MRRVRNLAVVGLLAALVSLVLPGVEGAAGRAIVVAAAVALAALAGVGYRAFEEWNVYPRPWPAPAWPPPPAPHARDIELRAADGSRLHARWWPHPAGHGAVLYCHGNAGDVCGRDELARELARGLGEPVLIFDYPGYGCSAGRPTEAGCYAAAAAAYDWLTKERGIPPERILLYGESLGGGVAVDLALTRPHRALVLNRSFTSVPDVAGAYFPWLPVRWLMANRFDNLSKMGRCPRPIFIAEADCDEVIPPGHGERLLAAAKAPARRFVLQDSGHNDPLPDEFFAAVWEFLQEEAPVSAAG